MFKAGYVDGKPYWQYADNVKSLIRDGKLNEAERLLLRLIEATEAESRIEKLGVAPFYYEKLAMLHHKQKDYKKEVEILERFAMQKHAPGVKPRKLVERLRKIKELLNRQGN